jgi:hypothetical protein
MARSRTDARAANAVPGDDELDEERQAQVIEAFKAQNAAQRLSWRRGVAALNVLFAALLTAVFLCHRHSRFSLLAEHLAVVDGVVDDSALVLSLALTALALLLNATAAGTGARSVAGLELMSMLVAALPSLYWLSIIVKGGFWQLLYLPLLAPVRRILSRCGRCWLHDCHHFPALAVPPPQLLSGVQLWNERSADYVEAEILKLIALRFTKKSV